jgi:hypothetical protein
MAIGWIGQIGTGNIQAQAQALLAAQAAAAAAGTPADIASVIAANPGAYGYFIPALLRAMGPAQAQNLVGIIGGGAVAPANVGGWGGPGGVNPTPVSPVNPWSPGVDPYGRPYPTPLGPVSNPNPVNPGITPSGGGQAYVPLGGGAGAPGGILPGRQSATSDIAARQARLRAILGMGSAAAGVTAKLRGG